MPLCEAINGRPRLKSLIHGVVGRLDAAWMHWSTRPLLQVEGLPPLLTLRASHGVILVSNHRSFFDMFVCGAMLQFQTPWMQRLVFPVRKNFFYDSFTGLLVNILISGCSMWPPVFRDDRRDLNQHGFEQLASFLGPGAVVGLHPEGKRNKGTNPYQQLPTKAGLGRLVQACHPDTVVVPFFIAGLGNNFLHETTRARRKESRRGEPIRIRFCAPRRCSELTQLGDSRTITDAVMAAIEQEGFMDRALQEATTAAQPPATVQTARPT